MIPTEEEVSVRSHSKNPILTSDPEHTTAAEKPLLQNKIKWQFSSWWINMQSVFIQIWTVNKWSMTSVCRLHVWSKVQRQVFSVRCSVSGELLQVCCHLRSPLTHTLVLLSGLSSSEASAAGRKLLMIRITLTLRTGTDQQLTAWTLRTPLVPVPVRHALQYECTNMSRVG